MELEEYLDINRSIDILQEVSTLDIKKMRMTLKSLLESLDNDWNFAIICETPFLYKYLKMKNFMSDYVINFYYFII